MSESSDPLMQIAFRIGSCKDSVFSLYRWIRSQDDLVLSTITWRAEMQTNTHIKWIDLARTIAIFNVVLCHAADHLYSFTLESMSGVATGSAAFAFAALTVGRLGSVPLFLMITGYLLLDREYDSEGYARFLKTKWLHLLLCTWIWYVVYELFMRLYQGMDIYPLSFLFELLFVRTIGMGHAWYMPMILGMYLLIPLAANALRTISVRSLRIPLLVFCLYTFGYSFMNVVSNILLGMALSLKFSLGFSGGAYGIYMLLGYLVKKQTFRRIRPGVLAFLIVASVCAGTCFQLWAYGQDFKYNIWYDNPFILVGSTALFELCSRITRCPASRVTGFLSGYSFGVYLIHLMVLRVIRPWITALGIMLPAQVLLTWPAVLAGAYLLAWLISRIPRVGKYILYLK